MSSRWLSISIGESSVAIGEIGRLNGKLVCLASRSYEINNWASTTEVIDQWADAIRDFSQHQVLPIVSLYVAMPGPFDYPNGISYIKDNRRLSSLYCKNVRQLLAVALKIEENKLFFFNDAVCALTAEILVMEEPTEKVLGLYFDEGFGSALWEDQHVKDMELWDNVFLDGKTEDFFAATWFRRNYFELTGVNIIAINDINDFPSLTGKELFKVFADNLAMYLKTLVVELGVETVVLGGAILSISPSILTQLKRKMSAMSIRISLLAARAGHNASLIGAVVLQNKMMLEA